MNRLAVAALASVLLIGCAAPAGAPAQRLAAPGALARAPLPGAPVHPSTAPLPHAPAESTLRAELQRRGYPRAIVEGASAPLAFDAAKAVAYHRADGGVEVLAGPGAWLLATPTERFWVFANGLVVSSDEAAWRYDSPFGA